MSQFLQGVRTFWIFTKSVYKHCVQQVKTWHGRVIWALSGLFFIVSFLAKEYPDFFARHHIPQIPLKLPVWASIVGFGLVLVWSFYLAWRDQYQEVLRLKSPEVDPDICLYVASPVENETVRFHHSVRGSIFPADTRVDVLVLAGDDKWHRQGRAVVSGSAWSAECQFGDSERKLGGKYQIVAIGGQELSEKAYDKLPPGARSNRVNVNRLPPRHLISE